MRLSLGWKAALVAAAFLLLWLGHFVIAAISVRQTEVFVVHIDEAGKLRMYSQRIAFLVEGCSNGQLASDDAESCRARIRQALERYAASLASVRSISTRLLLPRDRDAVHEALDALEEGAAFYRSAAAAALEPGDEWRAARDYVLQHADAMPERAEALVRALVAGQIRVQRLRDRTNDVLQGVGLALLIAVVAIGRRQVLRPVREITRLAQRAGRGDYSGRVDYRSGDEIGALVLAFNQSNARTQRLIEELAAGRAAARRAEQEADSLLESAADGIVISGPDGRILRVNREAERIFGYSREQLLGAPVEMLIPRRSRSRHRDYRAAYVDSAIPRVMGTISKITGLRSDGSEVPLEITLSSVRLDEQLRVIAVVRDVTERERAEADRRRLLAILDATPDMIAIFTPDRKLCYLNPAGRELLGLGPQDPVEQHAIDALLAPSAQQLIAHFDEGGRLTHVSAIARDISERRQYEAQLLHRATHDQLTGLANRALFRDRLTQAVYHAERSGRLVALAFIDLDDFKQINDSLGHAAGDALLQEIAARLRRHLRKGDTRARLGGDEFAVILEDLGRPDDALVVVDGLMRELQRPMMLGQREIVVTTSIGISIYPRDAATVDELLVHADAAMYQAKAAGRNNYRLYGAPAPMTSPL